MAHRMRFGAAAVLIGVAALLAVACGAGSDSKNDRATIASQIATSPLFGLDLTDATDAATRSGAAVGGADCRPEAWRRFREDRLSRDVEINLADDSAAVIVTDDVTGTLLLDTTRDGIPDFIQKPYEHLILHRATFTNGPSGWRLTQIGPADLELPVPFDQTVSIQKVRVIGTDGSVWEATSPEQLFDLPAGISQLAPGTTVRFEAQVANSHATGCSADSFVYLHLRTDAGEPIRLRMVDDGSPASGDLHLGDGIFSRSVTIGSSVGYRRAIVDVIDADTLADPAAKYDVTAWGIAYRIQ